MDRILWVVSLSLNPESKKREAGRACAGSRVSHVFPGLDRRRDPQRVADRESGDVARAGGRVGEVGPVPLGWRSRGDQMIEKREPR